LSEAKKTRDKKVVTLQELHRNAYWFVALKPPTPDPGPPAVGDFVTVVNPRLSIIVMKGMEGTVTDVRPSEFTVEHHLTKGRVRLQKYSINEIEVIKPSPILSTVAFAL